MRRLLPPVLLALLCGACVPGMQVEPDEEPSAGRYRQVGVLPFSDPQGHGREIAERVGRGLPRLGCNPVDLAQLEAVFARLKIDYSSGLSRQSLADVRRATFAEVLVFGSVDSGFKEVSVVAVETETGELIFKTKVRASYGRSFRGGEEAADAVLQAVSQAGLRPAAPKKGKGGKEETELPEPQ